MHKALIILKRRLELSGLLDRDFGLDGSSALRFHYQVLGKLDRSPSLEVSKL